MNITDTHCDTLCRLADENLPFPDKNLHVSYRKLNNCNTYTQFFSCFIDPCFYTKPVSRCRELINTFKSKVLTCEGIVQCVNFSQLMSSQASCRMCAFLSIEGGECIDSIQRLSEYYSSGVRMVALVWNKNNLIGCSAAEKEDSGLSDYGKNVIREMNKLRIVCDVSHMSEKTFYDTLECTSLPPVASHSCSKTICSHPRNLTDDQFNCIKEKNGFVGINFYPPFLNSSGSADITDILRHMEHFLELGGEDIIGLGSDFDGIDSLPRGIESIGDIDILISEMYKIGWSHCLVEKILSKNMEKIIRFF